MDKINSLTGMPDLIGQKSNESNSSNKIFETEIALIKIFESYSLNEISGNAGATSFDFIVLCTDVDHL